MSDLQTVRAMLTRVGITYSESTNRRDDVSHILLLIEAGGNAYAPLPSLSPVGPYFHDTEILFTEGGQLIGIWAVE